MLAYATNPCRSAGQPRARRRVSAARVTTRRAARHVRGAGGIGRGLARDQRAWISWPAISWPAISWLVPRGRGRAAGQTPEEQAETAQRLDEAAREQKHDRDEQDAEDQEVEIRPAHGQV